MREARRSVASEPEAALDAEDELVDLTEALVVRSKRTERQKRKQKTKLASGEPVQLHDLPTELILDILSYLRPNDVFRLTRTSKSLHAFVTDHRRFLASKIIEYRYPCLQKSLRLPALLEDVRPDLRQALRSDKRQRSLHIHKKPYQHQLEPPDPAYVCTCLTCVLRWNALCIAVDFAHWQSNLEKGEPIPVIGRGQSPAWNQKLIAEHAAVVRKALRDPLYYAAILETHLSSTTRSIRCHSRNKGNKRRRFRMTEEDERSGTDAFLARSGPPTFDIPFHRDEYYMLEAFLPNRGWNTDEGRWMYLPEDQHNRDVELVWRRLHRETAGMAADGSPGIVPGLGTLAQPAKPALD